MAKALRNQALLEFVQAGGDILLKHFGKLLNVRQKENPSSVVCDADLAAEKHIIQQIRARFPQDSIMAEESGYAEGVSGYTWVIDPLDGTSNFVAGLPWFGCQMGVLFDGSPLCAGMCLPIEKTLYFCVAGHGVYRNGKKVSVTSEPELKNVLCAFGFDASAKPSQKRQNANLLMRVAEGVRNTRATNSLFDFCYTLDGRFGGCINLNCKIWDIVPVALMLPEAGGVFTSLQGDKIVFRLGEQFLTHSYAVLGASRALHPKLLKLTTAG